MALKTEGIIVRRGDGATPTEAFAEVGEVKSLSGIGGGSPTVIDTSHLRSTFRRKLLGIRDEGQGQMQLEWTGSDVEFQGLFDDRANATLRNFQVEYPDGTEDEFAAYVMTFETAAETDASLLVNITLEIDVAIDRTWPA